MRSPTLAAALAALSMLVSSCGTAPGEEQSLVDRATLTVQDMSTQTVSDGPISLLRKARAAMICPRVFKAGFFFGGEGGQCVLLARAGNGTWSYPAFYTIGSGSFGLQIGIQDAQVFLLIMTEKGLNAVMDSQVKLGADASLAIATIGAGVNGSTTTAVGADIVAFSSTRGLYGGISLAGSLMSTQTEANQRYYGQPMAARQVVVAMQASNRGADPLREVLTRNGGSGPAPEQPRQSAQPPSGYAPAYPPQQQGGGYQQPAYQAPQGFPAGGGGDGGGRGPIQEQSLAPPR